jgi:hypothetical protein
VAVGLRGEHRADFTARVAVHDDDAAAAKLEVSQPICAPGQAANPRAGSTRAACAARRRPRVVDRPLTLTLTLMTAPKSRERLPQPARATSTPGQMLCTRAVRRQGYPALRGRGVLAGELAASAAAVGGY